MSHTTQNINKMNVALFYPQNIGSSLLISRLRLKMWKTLRQCLSQGSTICSASCAGMLVQVLRKPKLSHPELITCNRLFPLSAAYTKIFVSMVKILLVKPEGTVRYIKQYKWNVINHVILHQV